METLKHKTAEQLREIIKSKNDGARSIIASLFDEGTFVEIGTYIKTLTYAGDSESAEFEGVVTGYGAIDGRLVFAFLQDSSSQKGAFGEAHAKKITNLYDMAIKNKAPVIGVFDSNGAKINEGIGTLSAYGTVISKVSEASRTIPQIALITGVCGGSMAAIAAMFDFIVADDEKGSFFVNPPFIMKGKFKDSEAGTVKGACEDGTLALAAKNVDGAISKLKKLFSYLPQNSKDGCDKLATYDDINRLTPEIDSILLSSYRAKDVVSVIADDGEELELYKHFAREIYVGFCRINGRTIGVNFANNTMTADAAIKCSKFIAFCGAFKIPLLTLVNTDGFDYSAVSERKSYAAALSSLAFANTLYNTPKVTVILGKAYGTSATLLSSKALGADIVFSLDDAKISSMSPEAAVEFLYSEKIKNSDTPDVVRKELLEEWNTVSASPLNAARNGDIDDIIASKELRQRIAAAFEMLTLNYGG